VRDIEPGELLVLDKNGFKEDRFAEPKRKALCAMEYIYFARPDSDLNGTNLHSARKRMGSRMALEAFVTRIS
jgi:amidophosphoribosyltransferase